MIGISKPGGNVENFVIIATPRFGQKGFIAAEVSGHERAINECMRIFREGTMHRVTVVNEALEIIFKDTRKCKCTNVQKTFAVVYGKQEQEVEKCMDCNIVINHDGWKRGMAFEAPVEDEAMVG